MKRCKWCNLDNPLYVKYHDDEWGVLNTSDDYLFEMLILESFQAGLSWECVLNKRKYFRLAYDNFDIDKVILYDDDKVNELLGNDKIIRNKLKIKASINNAKVFKSIQTEFGSFYNYLLMFTSGNILYETGNVSNELSDLISYDLIKRGMKFVGSKIIYSFLQATGFIYSHEDCFLSEVLKVPLTSISIDDKFFDSLKRDYKDFSDWFLRKQREGALCYVTYDSNITSFLLLKFEDVSSDYSDFSKSFKSLKRLKISTFKSICGNCLMLMDIIFDVALSQNVSEIYVTVFPKFKKLINLFKEYGFEFYCTKDTITSDLGVQKEFVLVKKL